MAGKEIETLCADLPCEVTASGVMSGMMSYMTGSGVSLQVYGSDMEELQSAARALGQRVAAGRRACRGVRRIGGRRPGAAGGG